MPGPRGKASPLLDSGVRRNDENFREPLIKSNPFGLSLSNPLFLKVASFDRLRANGINQRSLVSVLGF